jgi:hypothetical protein
MSVQPFSKVSSKQVLGGEFGAGVKGGGRGGDGGDGGGSEGGNAGHIE